MSKQKYIAIALVPTPGWKQAKATLERAMLTAALEEAAGNMAAAGRMLGITKVAVLFAVRRHGLEHLTASARDAAR